MQHFLKERGQYVVQMWCIKVGEEYGMGNDENLLHKKPVVQLALTSCIFTLF